MSIVFILVYVFIFDIVCVNCTVFHFYREIG